MKKLTLLIIVFLGIIVRAEVIHLYVLAGQSNAIGWFGDAAYYPADPSNLDSNILLAYKVDDKTGGGPASNGWISMQKQVGRYATGHFGPEVTFSRKLAQEGNKIAIFKYGQGGTSLADDWGKPGANKMYDRMKTRLLSYIDLLKNQGHTVILKGLIWIQGEEDTKTATNSINYISNVSHLIIDMKFLAASNGNSNLNVIFGIADFSPQVNTTSPKVLQAQQNLAKNNCYIISSSMRGLPQQDFLHITPEGIKLHGERLYRDLKNFTYGLGESSVDITGESNSILTCGGVTPPPPPPPTPTYCSSSSVSYNKLIISRVATGSINKFSSGSKYTNFTSLSTNVLQGSSNSITVRAWMNSTITTAYYSAWIDYNKNNLFEESERITSGILNASGELTTYFTAPSNAVTGSTRMRVSLSQTEYPSPCANMASGEVEDYTINIVQSTSGGNSAYCIPNALNSSKILISRVKIGTINNYTSGTKYKFYNTISTNLLIGNNLLTLRSWSSYANPKYYYKAWIDYNHNGIFDTNELILNQTLNTIGENNYHFTIPSTALTGTTRMRIMLSKDNALDDSCSSIIEGETEDYQINITNSTSTFEIFSLNKMKTNLFDRTDFESFEVYDYYAKLLKKSSSKYINDINYLPKGNYIIVLIKKDKSIEKINYRK